MLVVYFVNYLILGDHQNPVILKDAAGTLSVSSESDMWTVTEGWRYMFGSAAYPAAFFGMLLFFVPKTPRYLVMIDQDQKAYSILKKVNGATKAQEILAEIKATSQEKTEKLFTYGAAVIVIGILLSVFQQAIGINAVLYYAPRIFENAGAEGGGMMQTASDENRCLSSVPSVWLAEPVQSPCVTVWVSRGYFPYCLSLYMQLSS